MFTGCANSGAAVTALPQVPNRVAMGDGGGAGVLWEARPVISGDGGEEGLGVKGKFGSKSSTEDPSRPLPCATRFSAAGANNKNISSPSSSHLRLGVTKLADERVLAD